MSKKRPKVKAQPFKTNGNGEELTIGYKWPYLSRRTRRMIERLVKKGKNPNFVDMLDKEQL